MNKKIVRLLPILAGICALAMLQPQSLRKQAIAKIIATHDVATVLKKLKQLPADLQTDIIQAMMYDPRFSQQDLQFLVRDLILSLPKNAENVALLAAYQAALNSDPVALQEKINVIALSNYPTIASILIFKNSMIDPANIQRILKILQNHAPEGTKEYEIIKFFLVDLFNFLTNNRKELIKNGFNAVIIPTFGEERYPTAPIIEAIYKNNIHAIGFLLEHGANPNILAGVDMPLETAINQQSPEIVRLLLEHSAIIQFETMHESPFLDPLFKAAEVNNENIFQLLINAGGNINKIYNTYDLGEGTLLDHIIGIRRNTPGQYEAGYDRAIAVLRKYGAKTLEELNQDELY